MVKDSPLDASKRRDERGARDPASAAWLPSGEVLPHLELRPGMRIVDVGAGEGHLAFALAAQVGPEGRVFAVESRREMVWELAEKLEARDAPRNLRLIEGDAASINLPDRSCDLVVVENLLHRLDDRIAALREARRLMCAGGRLAIIDWCPGAERPPGPPPVYRLSVEAVVKLLKAVGCAVLRSVTVGPYNHLTLAECPERKMPSGQ